MTLLQIGEILIDEDEARENLPLAPAEVEIVTCPKCKDTSLLFGYNYCSNCGQKVTWFTKTGVNP